MTLSLRGTEVLINNVTLQVVVEKRDRMSRNNVLHLWPFVIEDLRALGAKKFFGKFCAGAIDHISIRQLQCILMKVALLLGVEIHTEVSFEKLLHPPTKEESQESKSYLSKIGYNHRYIMKWTLKVNTNHVI